MNTRSYLVFSSKIFDEGRCKEILVLSPKAMEFSCFSTIKLNEQLQALNDVTV